VSFVVTIPTLEGQEQIQIEAGSSIIFVGANGSGKTRLAKHIEDTLSLNSHRISAHRALTLNPSVPKISEKLALLGLRTGSATEAASADYREGHRWQSKGSVALLNDFDFVVQVLFAEQSNKSLETHNKVRGGDTSSAEPTKFETLVEIWERLLPHRKLHISGDDIQVSITGKNELYSGSEMSDGERAIFYMLGQALVVTNDSLIIFDEPELHVHRSIMANLWDELEAVRPDCAFVFITHDLEFASSRVADKYILQEYNSRPYWKLEKVPDNTGFSEELTTLILGSRKPILFIEGNHTSLDIAIYRSCYKNWTVIPKGSCEDVIHSVVTMRGNSDLTRITCSGIVDADDYSEDDKSYLASLGIATLPVSEIENIILLPSVSQAIAENEGYNGEELETKLHSLAESVFNTLDSERAINKVVTRYCRRRIDRLLKKIDLSEASSVTELENKYNTETALLNINDIASLVTDKINQALADQDLIKLLENYDNKGLLALAASLKNCRREAFESWLVRVLSNNSVPDLTTSIKEILPRIEPQ
jgi:ABC-type cobalamin/Fe3+-siderophores transport system ATPase subunit/BMFP domain-containing protein YqiC